MGDCLQTGKPSWCITSTKINLAFYLSGADESRTVFSGWGYGWMHSPFSCGRKHSVIPYDR